MKKEKRSNMKKLEPVKKWPIIWAVIHKAGKEKPVCIGVCGYSWKPCFIGSILEAITVHDLYLNKSTGECEEGNRCLNVSCPFNKTTLETFAANCNVTSTQLLIKKLKTKWPKIIKDVATYLPFAEKCREAYARDPKVNVIEFGSEEHPIG